MVHGFAIGQSLFKLRNCRLEILLFQIEFLGSDGSVLLIPCHRVFEQLLL